MKTKQTAFWSGEFGKEYTDRNAPADLKTWESESRKLYGVSKLNIFDDFIGHFDKESRILEVGCNIGLQLNCLQHLGFKNLYGIELQKYAVEKSKSVTEGINIIQGSAFDLPFKDGYFDLVMTNGVLIHISPSDIVNAMTEIYRCSRQYILGFEYFNEETNQVPYRGHEGFLWKSNFAEEYKTNLSNLSLIKEEHYPYMIQSEKGNIDTMFLLEKA